MAATCVFGHLTVSLSNIGQTVSLTQHGGQYATQAVPIPVECDFAAELLFDNDALQAEAGSASVRALPSAGPGAFTRVLYAFHGMRMTCPVHKFSWSNSTI